MYKRLIYSIICILLVLGLSEGQVWGKEYLAAYWDGDYGSAWAGDGSGTRDALDAAGYEILDADQLKTWMDARISDKVPSVVVFCRDAVPDTVAETMSATCTLRKYLDAGGKIVWQSDIPFYYMASEGVDNTTWGDAGASAILGFNTAGAPRDTYNVVTITPEGIEWGITETWESRRPANPGLVDIVLATDNSGNAAAWVKHYVPGDEYGGFVRIRDTSGQANVEDLMRIAEYGLGGNPLARGPNPADGAIHPETWATITWFPGDFAVSHDVYFSDNFDDVNDDTPEAFRGNQDSTYFAAGFVGYPYPDGLVPGTTYYWRIDEVNEADPNSPWRGKIWSFWFPPKTAYEPIPADGSKFINSEDLTLSWTPGHGAAFHTVYFSANFDDVNDGVNGIQTGVTTYTPGPLESDKTYYWRVDEFEIQGLHRGDIWSFKTMPEISVSDPNLVGWWKLDESPGNLAIDWSGHDNHGTLQGNPQWITGYDGGALEFTQSGNYVDCGNAEILNIDFFSVTFWCNIPNTQGYNHMVSKGSHESASAVNWGVMMHGDQERILFESFNDTTWPGIRADTTTNKWHHVVVTYDRDTMQIYHDGVLAETTSGAGMLLDPSRPFLIGARSDAGSAGAFFTGSIDDVRIYNKILTQDEIIQVMRGDTTRAWNANPADGAVTDVWRAASLNWSAGDSASQHAVYFGTDEAAVADAETSDTTGVFRGLQAGTSYIPPEGVEWGGGSYYWRIDEHNTDDTVTKGTVWTFSVADYIIVDDIEDYSGENPIWENWLDGVGYGVQGNPGYYPGNGTGSAAGDEMVASTAEETIVHGGSKAMPVWYNNTSTAISEIELTLPGQDWTAYDLLTLSMWFYGDVTNVPGQLYVKVNGVQKLYDGDAANLTKTVWQSWNIDLSEFGNLQSVTKLIIGVQGNGTSGKLIFDDIRLYALPRETITPVQPDPAGLVAHYAFDGNANDSAGSNHGTIQGNPQWVLGYHGNALAFDGFGDWLECGNDPSLGISGAVSVTAWVNIGAAGIDHKVGGNQDNVNGGYKMSVVNDKIEFEIRTSSNTAVLNRDVAGGTILEVGLWYHVTGIYSQQDGYIRTYVNGLLDRELLTNGVLSASPGSLYIGCEPFNTEGGNFNGILDDVRIYNRVLSDAEIAGLAGMTKPFDKPL